MKFLILSKGPALLNYADAESLGRVQDKLHAGMKAGKVEAAYGLVAGGIAMVVNVESNAELARSLRRFHLAGSHDVEVIPLVGAQGVLDTHLEHRAATS